jgi:hypothetical protein
LKRQHRLICAAIHSGRIDDLKKMTRSAREQAAPVAEAVTTAPVAEEFEIEDEVEERQPVVEEFEFEYGPITQEWTPPTPRVEEPVVENVEETTTEFEVAAADEFDADQQGSEEQALAEVPPDGLVITMLDDEEFFANEKYILRVLITDRVSGDETPLPSAVVSIKILGTTFRPLIYSLKTERDGVATVVTQIPAFTSGRAAVLVRAVAKDQAAELRRIIHPAK